MTGVIKSVRERLGRVIIMTTQCPRQLMTYIPKVVKYRNLGNKTWLNYMEIISMQAKTQNSKGARITSFDTDLSNIGVDN